MAFTAQDVKTLREMTGCGMMDCKKALTETDGDQEKAIEYLREKGLSKAAKKAGRIAAEGMVGSFVYGDTGVVVEVNSETDFVAKNADFQKFVEDIAKTIANNAPADVEELKTLTIDGGSQTVGDALTEKIATIGENMNIRRFETYKGVNQSYVHAGGRIGVLVNFEVSDASKAETPEFVEMAKNVAMQIAAAAPEYLTEETVPTDVVEKEAEILKQQALNEGKPEAIVDKMVAGRIKKYYKEVCLVDQAYVKDPDMSVQKYVDGVANTLGTEIKIAKFARFEKGEGMEKKQDNFAEEVASMMK